MPLPLSHLYYSVCNAKHCGTTTETLSVTWLPVPPPLGHCLVVIFLPLTIFRSPYVNWTTSWPFFVTSTLLNNNRSPLGHFLVHNIQRQYCTISGPFSIDQSSVPSTGDYIILLFSIIQHSTIMAAGTQLTTTTVMAKQNIIGDVKLMLKINWANRTRRGRSNVRIYIEVLGPEANIAIFLNDCIILVFHNYLKYWIKVFLNNFI